MLAQPVTISANAEIPIHRNPFIKPPRDTFVSSLLIPLLLSLDSTRVIAAMARRIDLPLRRPGRFLLKKKRCADYSLKPAAENWRQLYYASSSSYPRPSIAIPCDA